MLMDIQLNQMVCMERWRALNRWGFEFHETVLKFRQVVESSRMYVLVHVVFYNCFNLQWRRIDYRNKFFVMSMYSVNVWCVECIFFRQSVRRLVWWLWENDEWKSPTKISRNLRKMFCTVKRRVLLRGCTCNFLT